MLGSSLLLAECSHCFGSTKKQKSPQRMWHSGWGPCHYYIFSPYQQQSLFSCKCGGTRRRVLMIGLWNRMWHRDVTATQWRTFVLTANAVARRARRQQVERQNGYFGLQFGGWLNKMVHFPLVFTRADAEPASVFMHGALVLQRYFGVHLHNMDLPHQKWKLSFSAHLEYWHSE